MSTGSFPNSTTLFHPQIQTQPLCRHRTIPIIRSSSSGEEDPPPLGTQRRRFVAAASFLAAGGINGYAPTVLAEKWGTRSFMWERFFGPGLSPEDSAARIRQTAQGLHSMREMLETTSWRYVLFYIRLKMAYLDQDLKTALATVPETRRKSYVKTANELVDNMLELDRYVRSPKVYESYVYYEKALKSIDDIVAMLA